VPAFERLASFLRDFDALTPGQKAAFLRAVSLFVADLRDGNGFRKSLRVKKMAGYDNVWELTWAPMAGLPSDTAPRSRKGIPVSAGGAWAPTTSSSVTRRPPRR
jgi:hypothetical protein